MSNFSTIKQAIVDIVEANALVNEVFDHDSPTFNKTPSVTVVTSGNDADFATTAHNRRMYAFTITIYVPFDAQGASSAEQTMTAVVDSLIDDFDQNVTLSGACLMMTAAPSAWGWSQREALYRVAPITLRCMTQFNVTQ